MRRKKRQVGDPGRNYAKEWKGWREFHGMTQAEIALALRMSLRTVKYIERGIHRPSVSSRMKMEALQKRYAEAA